MSRPFDAALSRLLCSVECDEQFKVQLNKKFRSSIGNFGGEPIENAKATILQGLPIYSQKRTNEAITRLEDGKLIKNVEGVLTFLNSLKGEASKDGLSMGDGPSIRPISTSVTKPMDIEPNTYIETKRVRQPPVNSSNMEAMETDDSKARLINAGLRTREHSLFGPSKGKLISEAQMVRDCIFVMQNIDGHYIRWNEANNKFQLVNNVKCNICDESFANKLAFLGFLVKQILQFHDQKTKDEKYGMVGNALLLSIQAEIHDFIQEVGFASIDQQKFTLKSLNLYFSNWGTKLKFLGYLVFNLSSKKGGEILTVLNTVMQHGNPVVHEMYLNIITTTSRPFMLQIDNWIYEGKLYDPNGEFFISADIRVPVEALWYKRYRTNNAMIPSFLKPSEAQKILLIGKSINFLREVCHQPLSDFMNPADDSGNFNLDLNAQIMRRIDETYESTSTRLLHVMKTEYKLMVHFRAMRNYMLLGQGDFVHYLLDVLESELIKPASSLYKRNLSEQLITATQCTNAQYDDEEVLRSLDVRLLEINPGDVGWDVFSLDYTVTGPLLTIFPKDVMKQYIRIFNFLLRAKRMEYNLNHRWGRMMSIAKSIQHILPEMSQVMPLASLIAAEMSFFVNQLQYYINFEILECSWAILEDKMHTSKDLDELIAAHSEFLQTLNDGCFLTDRLWNNLKDLRSIFDQIVRFETKVYRVILDEAEEECNRRKCLFKREINDEELERRKHFKNSLLRHKNKLGTVRDTYQNMVRDFLVGLTKSSETNLRCLSWRLDFNNFYKDSKF